MWKCGHNSSDRPLTDSGCALPKHSLGGAQCLEYVRPWLPFLGLQNKNKALCLGRAVFTDVLCSVNSLPSKSLELKQCLGGADMTNVFVHRDEHGALFEQIICVLMSFFLLPVICMFSIMAHLRAGSQRGQ